MVDLKTLVVKTEDGWSWLKIMLRFWGTGADHSGF
jgi:hypothetical protein